MQRPNLRQNPYFTEISILEEFLDKIWNRLSSHQWDSINLSILYLWSVHQFKRQLNHKFGRELLELDLLARK